MKNNIQTIRPSALFGEAPVLEGILAETETRNLEESPAANNTARCRNECRVISRERGHCRHCCTSGCPSAKARRTGCTAHCATGESRLHSSLDSSTCSRSIYKWLSCPSRQTPLPPTSCVRQRRRMRRYGAPIACGEADGEGRREQKSGETALNPPCTAGDGHLVSARLHVRTSGSTKLTMHCAGDTLLGTRLRRDYESQEPELDVLILAGTISAPLSCTYMARRERLVRGKTGRKGEEHNARRISSDLLYCFSPKITQHYALSDTPSGKMCSLARHL
jgi:hypothetical protein